MLENYYKLCLNILRLLYLQQVMPVMLIPFWIFWTLMAPIFSIDYLEIVVFKPKME